MGKIGVKRKRAKYVPYKQNKKVKATQDGMTRTSGFYGRYNTYPGDGRLMNLEKKFYDTTVTSTSVANGHIIASNTLNAMAAGTGPSERVGRLITVKSIHVKGKFTTNTSHPTDAVRFVVYLDQQCNGAAATTANLFLNGSSGNRPDVQSFLNMSNTRRFKILRDLKQTCDSNAVLNASTPTYSVEDYHFEIHISCNIQIEFGATTAGIANVKNNNIGIAVLSHQGTNAGFIAYVARIRYTDI